MALLSRKFQMIASFILVGAVMLKAGDALWQATQERRQYAPSKDFIDKSYKACAVIPAAEAAKAKVCRETVRAEVEKRMAKARKVAGDTFSDRLFSWHIG